MRASAGGRYACVLEPGRVLFETPDPEEASGWALRRLVEELMNPVKGDYPFIDLLKPENEAAIPLLLAAGEYVLDVAVHARDGAPYDYRKRLLSLSVTAPTAEVGVYAPRHEWRFEGGVRWEGPGGG